MEDGKDVEGDDSQVLEPSVELTALSRDKADECLNPESLDYSQQSHDMLHGVSTGSGPQLPVEGEMAVVSHQSESQSSGVVEAEQSSQSTQLTECDNAPTMPPPSVPLVATPPEAAATPPQASATPSSTPPVAPDTRGRRGRGDIGGEEFPVRSGGHSPFVFVKEERLVPVFESPGLLFAHGVDSRFVVGYCSHLLVMAGHGWLARGLGEGQS